MTTFDAETRRALRDIQEVDIRTGKHPKTAVTIWVVVSGEDVYVRSVRGSGGRWYRDLAEGGPAILEFSGRRLAAQALPVRDSGAIERASAEFLSKYRTSAYAPSMVKAEVLSTTLRLEPR